MGGQRSEMEPLAIHVPEGHGQRGGALPEPKSGPVRSCVTCRKTGGKLSLLRLVCDPAGRIRIDHLRRAPGRGAYVHPTGRCILGLLRKREALGRALRRNVVIPPATLEELERLIGPLSGPGAGQGAGGSHAERKGNEEP